MPTFQITGTWTGPSSPAGDFTRHQHCEHIRDNTKANREFIDAVRGLRSIVFTDGTALLIGVDDVTNTPASQRVPKKNGYGKLIRDCVRYGVNLVEDLPRTRP